MVKHQRRSHQRGIHSSEGDDSVSETGSEGSPATPKSHAAIPWTTHPVPMMDHPGHPLQRAASFANFGQPMPNYGMQQPYGHRHSLATAGAEYHGPPHTQAPLHQHDPSQQHHHPGMQLGLQRSHHGYFIPEQNNPGVATMNTNPFPNPPGLTTSIQSSPSTFSPGSVRSPSTQDGFYTHEPPTQAGAYALHATSPIEQQQPQMVGFGTPIQNAAAAAAQALTQAAAAAAAAPRTMQQPQQHPHHQQTVVTSGPPQQQTVVSQQQQFHQQQQQQQQQQPPQVSAEEAQQQWYNSVAAYQPPVEVPTIGQLPVFGSGEYDAWGAKLEFDDMPLPSTRVDTM